MISAIATLLQSDSELTTILSGGIYGKVLEINRQLTPDAFDANSELQPCAIIKAGTVTPFGPHVHGHSQSLEIYLYQRAGYTAIEAAARRIYQLLHNSRIEPTADFGCWLVTQTYLNLSLEDPALKCNLGLLRFQALISILEV